MNRQSFDLHVETQPTPGLLRGDAVSLGSQAVRESPKAAEAKKDVGSWLL